MIRQKQNFLTANWIAPAGSIQTFFDSSVQVVPSFLIRKVENKSFPCTHKRGERTRQVWRDNSRRVRTHEKKLRRLSCSPIGHNNTKHFLCPIRRRHPLEFLEIVRYPVGTQWLFCPYLKTFVPPSLPTRLTAPVSPRMRIGKRVRNYSVCMRIWCRIISVKPGCPTRI